MKSIDPKGGASVMILSAAYAVAMFHRAAFVAVAPMLHQTTGLDSAGLALVGSAFFWAYLFFQIPAGLLIDAAGPRRMGAAGCFAMAIGSALFALVDAPSMLIFARGLTAAGAVCVFISLVAQCRAVFADKARGAIGKGMLIGNAGGMLAGIPLAALLGSLPYQSAWLACAALAAVNGLAVLAGSPEDEAKPFMASLKRAIPAFGHALKKPHVYLGAGALAGLAGAFYAFVGFGSYMLGAHFGLDAHLIGAYTTAMLAGFALGAGFLGRLGDTRKMRKIVGVAVPCFGALLWLILTFCPPTDHLLLGVILSAIGFLSGSCGNLYTTLDLFSEPEARASALAAANCGIPLSAALIQMTQGWLPADFAAAPCALLALIGAWCCHVLSNRASAIEDATTTADPASELSPTAEELETFAN